MANHRLAEGGRSIGLIQLDLANEDTAPALDYDAGLERAFMDYREKLILGELALGGDSSEITATEATGPAS